MVINITPHIFLTPPIEVYRATNVRKNFVTTKFWQVFKLSHPIVTGGGQKPCSTKLVSYLVRNTWKHTIHALE